MIRMMCMDTFKVLLKSSRHDPKLNSSESHRLHFSKKSANALEKSRMFWRENHFFKKKTLFKYEFVAVSLAIW